VDVILGFECGLEWSQTHTRNIWCHQNPNPINCLQIVHLKKDFHSLTRVQMWVGPADLGLPTILQHKKRKKSSPLSLVGTSKALTLRILLGTMVSKSWRTQALFKITDLLLTGLVSSLPNISMSLPLFSNQVSCQNFFFF
jgi:hypothetical protein